MKAGAVEFLTKPFGDEELPAAIHTAITIDRAARVKRSGDAEVRRRYAQLTPSIPSSFHRSGAAPKTFRCSHATS
jgi:FixJ family two-component response regulator